MAEQANRGRRWVLAGCLLGALGLAVLLGLRAAKSPTASPRVPAPSQAQAEQEDAALRAPDVPKRLLPAGPQPEDRSGFLPSRPFRTIPSH